MGMLVKAYARLWALQQCLILLFAGFATPFQKIQGLLVLSCVMASEVACLPLLCSAIIARGIELASAAPYAWESFYWCIETDAAVLLPAFSAMAASRSVFLRPAQLDGVMLEAANSVRWQLACFYASAALFKVNYSFRESYLH